MLRLIFKMIEQVKSVTESFDYLKSTKLEF